MVTDQIKVEFLIPMLILIHQGHDIARLHFDQGLNLNRLWDLLLYAEREGFVHFGGTAENYTKLTIKGIAIIDGKEFKSYFQQEGDE